mmetsp:Transcript_57232/g.68858  ORF Transcript_57232/g.68858 Transcript_57232/m.68858 type:complete len:474 (-) Transcript_57232:126-1547(-)
MDEEAPQSENQLDTMSEIQVDTIGSPVSKRTDKFKRAGHKVLAANKIGGLMKAPSVHQLYEKVDSQSDVEDNATCTTEASVPTEKKKKAPINIDFWLVSTIQLEDLDQINERFTFFMFTKWYWRSLEQVEISRDDGREFVKNEEESENFPINPHMPFLNQLEWDELTNMSWAKVDKKLVKGEDGKDYHLVSAQKCFRVTLSTQLDMHNYPFDRHMLHAELAIRSWKKDGEKYRWNLKDEIPDWAPRKYEEDERIVSLKRYSLTNKNEINVVFPCLVYTETKKPALCVTIERDPHHAYRSIVLPCFIFVAVSMLPLFITDDSTFDEITSVSVGVLTLAAFQTYVSDRLPKSTGASRATKYIVFCYIFEIILGVAIIVEKGFPIQKTFDISHPELVVACVFPTFWVLSHVIFMYDYLSKSVFLEETLKWRTPWDDVRIPSTIISSGDSSDDRYKPCVKGKKWDTKKTNIFRMKKE